MDFHQLQIAGVTKRELLSFGVIVGADGELSKRPEHLEQNEAMVENYSLLKAFGAR